MIVGSHTVIFVAIFLAFALGGLAILRRQKSLSARGFLFILLCYACTWVTLWLARREQVLLAEAAFAWMVALLLVAVVEGFRFWRRKRSIA